MNLYGTPQQRRGCVSAWVRPGPTVRSGRYPGGDTRARGLIRIFAIAFGGLRAVRVGARARPGPADRGFRGSGGDARARGLARVFA